MTAVELLCGADISGYGDSVGDGGGAAFGRLCFGDISGYGEIVGDGGGAAVWW